MNFVFTNLMAYGLVCAKVHTRAYAHGRFGFLYVVGWLFILS